MSEIKKKTCFVVSQIGEDDSSERLHADWVYDEIINHVFSNKFENFSLSRSDKINNPGLIDAQIIDSILNVDLVIADLTNLNPNVFYEIGIRHVVAKPIIHIHLKGQRIPFDVSLYRSMPFSLGRPSDLRRARTDLEALVGATEAPDFEVDNPVVRARGRVIFEKAATSKEKLIENQINNLSSRISALEQSAEPSFSGDKIPYTSNKYANVGGIKVLYNLYIKFNQEIDQKASYMEILKSILNNGFSRNEFRMIMYTEDTIYIGIASGVSFDRVDRIYHELIDVGFSVTLSQ